ncbi:MFS transporter [Rhodothermus profundi]|uniref:Predicted arabinose efflux permease, MFS family n=1 Tax=Rhodothermus profundi TaxID=633813 RepID=A0A1M6TNF8_9BACT|nr:MFS transporter [Rhodothermus profundi]SHK58487.1 Predicted arabinose efflux permease, MFS family [Rhodothermus profundi]
MAAQSERHILLALWLMVFSASSQVIIMVPILPRIGATLGISAVEQGSLISVYAVMLSLMALVAGPVSDRLGRRPILLVGSAAMTGALLLHGIAYSYAALLAVRALAGAAGGLLSGAAVSYVGDYFPYERRGWANGWVMSGIAFGQIVGIPAGTLLAGWVDFRWPFLMFGLTMALATLLIWRYVPQPTGVLAEEPLSLQGMLQRYGELLRQPATAPSPLVYFLMFFSIGLFLIYLPAWLERTLGFRTEAMALLFLLGGLANVVAGPLAGRLSDRMGRKPLIVSATLGLAVLMAGAPFLMRSRIAAYGLFALAMALVGMRMSPLQSLLTALVPGARRGSLMSLSIALGQLGIGISGVVAGWLFTQYGYASNALLGALALLVMALVVGYGLPEPTLQSSVKEG